MSILDVATTALFGYGSVSALAFIYFMVSYRRVSLKVPSSSLIGFTLVSIFYSVLWLPILVYLLSPSERKES